LTPQDSIPFHRPSIGEEEIAEVTAVLRSGWLTTGQRTAQFEREFQDYVQAHHALAVNSCTAGLHLALAALGIGPGDEVITTPLTFCATVNTILQVGATPVLADISEDGNLDPAAVAGRITARTRAILPVHFGGLPCQMDAIWDLAARHGLHVIEDAAHAVGSRYDGRPIGCTQSDRRSDIVAFSFYATKNLTTGEGGMVTTHSQELYEKMRVLCLHGISHDAWNRYSETGSWFYQVTDVGFKYNLSDIQSAIGIHQLRRQAEFISRRTEYARIYSRLFSSVEELEAPPDAAGHCWHLYPIRLNLDRLRVNRNEFISRLREKGISASVHFIPIPLHSAYQHVESLAPDHCPRALSLYPRLVSLPLYPAMTEEQIVYVASAVKEIFQHSKSVKTVSVS
jgi:dTDP-4-amino-4,6-dideoxygalactose transaminase